MLGVFGLNKRSAFQTLGPAPNLEPDFIIFRALSTATGLKITQIDFTLMIMYVRSRFALAEIDGLVQSGVSTGGSGFA